MTRNLVEEKVDEEEMVELPLDVVASGKAEGLAERS